MGNKPSIALQKQIEHVPNKIPQSLVVFEWKMESLGELYTIPMDLLKQILSFLQPCDLCKLSKVSKGNQAV